jgi:hypothetical protein
MKVESTCVGRRIRANNVLVISDHVPHSLGLVKKTYAGMGGEDPAQESRAAPTHPDDEYRAIDSFSHAVCSEAQVPKHDWIPPASGGGNWAALKKGIAN